MALSKEDLGGLSTIITKNEERKHQKPADVIRLRNLKRKSTCSTRSCTSSPLLPVKKRITLVAGTTSTHMPTLLSTLQDNDTGQSSSLLTNTVLKKSINESTKSTVPPLPDDVSFGVLENSLADITTIWRLLEYNRELLLDAVNDYRLYTFAMARQEMLEYDESDNSEEDEPENILYIFNSYDNFTTWFFNKNQY